MDDLAWQKPVLLASLATLVTVATYRVVRDYRSRWKNIVVEEDGWRVWWTADPPFRDEELFGREMRRLRVHLRGPPIFPVAIAVGRTFFRPADEIKRGELERASWRIVRKLAKMEKSGKPIDLGVFDEWFLQVRDMPRIWKPGTVYGKPRGR